MTPSDPSPDPTRQSRWRPLFLLLQQMDAEIERVYADAGFPRVRARFILPLVRLAHLGPMTIRELAAECEVSHSAMSQTVGAMRRAGLVDSSPDPADGRARRVTLTPAAGLVVTLGEAEWAATESAVAELEAETPYPITRVVDDLERALVDRPFGERVRAHLPRRL